MKKLVSISIFLLAGILQAQINLNSGLTGYFPLDGNANDMSVTAINGTNNGATAITGFQGVANTAMDFDETQLDYISAGNNTRGVTNQMSVSFWFKTSGSGTYNLVEKYDWTQDAGFYIFISNGGMAMHGRDHSGVGFAPAATVTTYNDGQWHHVVGIVDNTEWILYVDCQEVQHLTTASVSPDISVNYPLTFGRYNYGTTNYFTGQLDEVRMYNRVLTTDEICYLCGPSIDLANQQVGYFKLDGNANDYSLTAINGTNNGASPIAGINAVPNTAMDFDETQLDYIDAGNNTRGITNQMSVSFWFKTSGSGTYNLVEKYDWTQDAGFYIFISNGGMAMHGRDHSGVGFAPAISATTYNDGQWHHVIGIVDNTEWILYVDCQEVQHLTTASVSPDISVNYPLTFGRYALGATNYFTGQLDEVRMYSRPLSNTEICNLCNNTVLMGINESNETKPLFTIYPNPTSNQINVNGLNQLTGDYFIQLSNMAGQQIVRIKNQSSLDLTNYSPGIYMLEIFDQSNHRVFTQKVIKK